MKKYFAIVIFLIGVYYFMKNEEDYGNEGN